MTPFTKTLLALSTVAILSACSQNHHDAPEVIDLTDRETVNPIVIIDPIEPTEVISPDEGTEEIKLAVIPEGEIATGIIHPKTTEPVITKPEVIMTPQQFVDRGQYTINYPVTTATDIEGLSFAMTSTNAGENQVYAFSSPEVSFHFEVDDLGHLVKFNGHESTETMPFLLESGDFKSMLAYCESETCNSTLEESVLKVDVLHVISVDSIFINTPYGELELNDAALSGATISYQMPNTLVTLQASILSHRSVGILSALDAKLTIESGRTMTIDDGKTVKDEYSSIEHFEFNAAENSIHALKPDTGMSLNFEAI